MHMSNVENDDGDFIRTRADAMLRVMQKGVGNVIYLTNDRLIIVSTDNDALFTMNPSEAYRRGFVSCIRSQRP